MVEREGKVRIPSGCAIAAVADRSGAGFGGGGSFDRMAVLD